ncbi:interleukin enhancer-binding factor 2-like [Paramacrobiotus metropolitanus]|uniref:interleukin enhancer-binding factor 2-like n=1 Tax=Paramacrobiotus metropolitanus TaxID=2943436 RepID=UPI0024456C97|nr:interleukin enhancer-binding factor 2-like [Paramacrobiotus metropolitanus]
MFPACDLYQISPSEYQRLTVEQKPDSSEAFKSAVFQRLFAITVPARSKDAVIGLVSKLQTVLEGIILQGASGMFTACIVDEVKLVGQYQKDTTITGPRELYAEIVIRLKTSPSVVTLRLLGEKIVGDLMQSFPSEKFGWAMDGYILEVSSSLASVKIHVTAESAGQNTPVPDTDQPDPDLVPADVLEASARLVEEAAWFANNASASNIKGLVRLLTDLRERHTSFSIFTDSALDLLAHLCVTALVEGSTLSIESAFRRFLELLSMGILMRDAWPTTELFLYKNVPVEQRVAASRTASELLCQISMGDFRAVLATH